MAALEVVDPIRVYFNADRTPATISHPGQAVPIPGARFWTLRTLSAEMRRNRPDLLFVPSYVIPPLHPRSVVTIHDLGFLMEPERHNPIHRRQLEWTTRWNVRAASGIIAISETTRQDLIERLNVNPAKIRTIAHGVSANFKPATPDEIARVRAKYALNDQFILAVGTIHPRKNLIRLIQAFEQLAPDEPGLQLVLCGSDGWRANETRERAARSPFSDRIQVVGYFPDEDMPALYSAAKLTAFVSLYEGFGLPAIESMASGTPVLASHRASLPEVCGDAAVFVDPHDAVSIADGIRRLLDDDSLRTDLTERQRERAKVFTWESCARQTLVFLREIRDNS